MGGFEERIVSEFFEARGFAVQRRRVYASARKRLAEEQVALVIERDDKTAPARAPQFLLFASEMALLRRAVVALPPWHTAVRLSPALTKGGAEAVKFLEGWLNPGWEKVLGETEGDQARLVVVPGMPLQSPQREALEAAVRVHGVSGVLSFRAMLLDVLEKLETHRVYGRTPELEILRLLKGYDLLKLPQMELFGEAGR